MEAGAGRADHPSSAEGSVAGRGPWPSDTSWSEQATDRLTVGPNRFAPLCPGTSPLQAPAGRLPREDQAADPTCPIPTGASDWGIAAKGAIGATALAGHLHCSPLASPATTPARPGDAPTQRRPACLPAPRPAPTAPSSGDPPLPQPHHWLRCCTWHLAHAAGLLRLHRALRRALGELGRHRLPTPGRCRRLFHGLDSCDSIDLLCRHSVPSSDAAPPGGLRRHGASPGNTAGVPDDWLKPPARLTAERPLLIIRATLARRRLVRTGNALRDPPRDLAPCAASEVGPLLRRPALRHLRASRGATSSPARNTASGTAASSPVLQPTLPLPLSPFAVSPGALPSPRGDPAALGPTQLWGLSPAPAGGPPAGPPVSPTLPYDAQAGWDRAQLALGGTLEGILPSETSPPQASPSHPRPPAAAAGPLQDGASYDAPPLPGAAHTGSSMSHSQGPAASRDSGPGAHRLSRQDPDTVSPSRRTPRRVAADDVPTDPPDSPAGAMCLFAWRLRCLRNSNAAAYSIMDADRLGGLHTPLIWCSAVSAFSEQAEAALRRCAAGSRTLLGLAAWWRRQGVLDLPSAWQILRGLSLWRGVPPPSHPLADIHVAVQADILGQAGADGSLTLDLLHPTPAGRDARPPARPPPAGLPTGSPLEAPPAAAGADPPAALGRLASWTAQLQDTLRCIAAGGPSDDLLDSLTASLVWLSATTRTLAACRFLLAEHGYRSCSLTYLRRLWDSQAVRSLDDARHLALCWGPHRHDPPLHQPLPHDAPSDSALALLLADHISLRPVVAADLSTDPAHFSRHQRLAGQECHTAWEAASRSAASLARVLPLLQQDPDVSERAGPWAVAGDALIWIAAFPPYRDTLARLLRHLSCGEEGWRRLCGHMDRYGFASPSCLASALSQAPPLRGVPSPMTLVAFQTLPLNLQASVLADAGLGDFSGGGQLRRDLAESTGDVERSTSGALRTLRALNEESLRRNALHQAFRDTCEALRRAAQHRRPLSSIDRSLHSDVLTTAAFWLTIEEQDASEAATCPSRLATSEHHLRHAAMHWRLAGYSTPAAALRLLQEQVFWEQAAPEPSSVAPGVPPPLGRWTAPLHPLAPWRTFDPLPRLTAARLEPWSARGSALLDDLLSAPVAPAMPEPTPGLPAPLLAGLLRSGRPCRRLADRRCRVAGDASVSLEEANALATTLRRMLHDGPAGDADEAWIVTAVWLLLPCHARTVLLPLLVSLAIDATPFIALTDFLQDANIGCPGDLQARLSAASPDAAVCPPYAAFPLPPHPPGAPPSTSGAAQETGAPAASPAHTDAVRSLLQSAGVWAEAKAAVARRGQAQLPAPYAGGPADPSDRCAICLQERPPQAQGWPGCGHEFCPDCAAQWAALTPPLQAPACPICRTPARIEEDGSLGPVQTTRCCRCSGCTAPIPDGRGPLCAYCRASTPASLPDDEGPGLAGDDSASDTSPRRDAIGRLASNLGRSSASRDAAASPLPPPLFNPWQLADVARSVNHDAWAGGSALHTRFARAIIDHVSPGAVLAPSPADFLADPDLSDLHLPCFPAEPEGYGQALAAARHFAAEDTGLDELPLVLMVHARGGQLQAILSRAAQMDISAHVVLLGSVQADPCTRDGWQLAALVHKLWGHRAVNALSHVAPVGQPIRSRLRGARQFFLAVATTLRPCTIDPPLTRLSLCPAAPHTVGPLTVMAQASRRDDFDVELARATHTCLAAGTRLLVFPRSCWPSLEPGMQDEDVQPLTIYIIRWAGTCPAQAGVVRTALQALKDFASLEATPTHWITAVSASDLPGAILYPVSAAAMCTVAARWQKTAAQLGGRAVATPAGLGLLNVPPAVAQVCLEAVPHRDPALAAPMRLTGHVASTSGDPPQPHHSSDTSPSPRSPLHLDFTLTPPTAGHDLLWLVATGGQHTAHSVARAATDGLGATVAAAEENAWNPLSRAFEQMVLLTIPGHTRDAMERGPGAQRTLLVDGHALPLLPFTHFAPLPAPRSPRVDTPAENLRSSILRGSASGAHLGARTTMVAPPVVRMPRGHSPAGYNGGQIGGGPDWHTHYAIHAVWHGRLAARRPRPRRRGRPRLYHCLLRRHPPRRPSFPGPRAPGGRRGGTPPPDSAAHRWARVAGLVPLRSAPSHLGFRWGRANTRPGRSLLGSGRFPGCLCPRWGYGGTPRPHGTPHGDLPTSSMAHRPPTCLRSPASCITRLA